MIWLTGPKSRDFSSLNLMAVQAAHRVQKPDAFFMYCNEEPVGNIYWDQVKNYCQIVHVDAPSHYGEVDLNGWPQYQSDVIRLQKMYEIGGIYLDTDSFLLKPLDDLMHHKVVLSGTVEGRTKDPGGKGESVSGGVMMAAPKSEFFKAWLDRLEEGLNKHIWAWHCVCLPVIIAKENPEYLHVLPQKAFTPFDFYDEWIWEEVEDEEKMSLFEDPYAAHMWDSVVVASWVDKFKMVNEEYLNTSKSLVARLLRRSYGDRLP